MQALRYIYSQLTYKVLSYRHLLFRIIPENRKNKPMINRHRIGAKVKITSEICTVYGTFLNVMELPPKEVEIRSKGYFANSKMEINRKR